MKQVLIYTDGACSGNPGNGGYCAILIYNGIEKVVSGSELDTTNNRMELLAVIKGLEALKEPCSVRLFSDSQYVVDAFNKGWIGEWQSRGWKTAGKSPVKNVDLWQRLLELLSIHLVEFVKVKGHADNPYNNRCDKIAVDEYKKLIK
ncbi:MAG: ribonuclease HI [Clostridiales bacterium]|nr:ribonuclease HI [Clostridiales bacterium]